MDFPVFPVCVPFGEMGNSFPEINSGLEIIGVPWDKIHPVCIFVSGTYCSLDWFKGTFFSETPMFNGKNHGFLIFP